MKSKDFDGLVDFVELMAKKHKTIVSAGEVFSALIQAGDGQKKNLQRCIDAMSNCQGEMATLNALIVSLVECGKIEEAKLVLETPGLRALPRFMSWACEHLISKGKEDCILPLISVVRGLYNVDVEDMYFRLIKGYGRQKNNPDGEQPGWRKALNVYEKFEEESVQPRPRTLRYLADILNDHSQPIPFEVPKVSRNSKGDTAVTSPTDDGSLPILKHVRKAVELLAREKIEDVVKIRSELDENGEKEMGTTFLRLLVQHLIDKHSHDLLVKLSSALTKTGAVDDVILLHDVAQNPVSQELPDWCWDRLSIDFVHCHERSGRLHEFVKNITHGKKDVSVADLRKYLSLGALTTLHKVSNQADWEKMDKLIRDAAGNLKEEDKSAMLEKMSLLNRLWTVSILSSDIQRAKKLEGEYPEL